MSRGAIDARCCGILLRRRCWPATAASGRRPAPLLVVYGPEAPSREGDPDHVERLFVSVPADYPERLYLRVFDPEPAGANDTRYGRSKEPTATLFRLSGGAGRLRRRAAAGRGRGRGRTGAADPAYAGFAGGRVLAERRFDEASPTDGTWVTLAPFTARATATWSTAAPSFRLDVDRRGRRLRQRLHRRGEPVARPLRPAARGAALRLRADDPLARPRADPTEVRFDGAGRHAAPAAELRRRRGRARAGLDLRGAQAPASGQDEWRVDRLRRARRARRRSRSAAALESPNDVTLARLRRRRRSRSPLAMPPLPAPRAPRPVAVGLGAAARQLHLGRLRRLGLDRRRPARLSAGASATAAESDAPVIAHPFAEPGRYQAELDVLGARRPDRAAGRASPCRCTSGRRRSPRRATR